MINLFTLLVGVLVGLNGYDIIRGIASGQRDARWWFHVIETVFALTVAILIIAGLIPPRSLR